MSPYGPQPPQQQYYQTYTYLDPLTGGCTVVYVTYQYNEAESCDSSGCAGCGCVVLIFLFLIFVLPLLAAIRLATTG